MYIGQNRLLVRTRWGGRLFAHADDLSITPDLALFGEYDPAFAFYLQRRLHRGSTAFDVGANIGLFTVLMAELVGPTGRVVAYEPAPQNAALLRENVAMNYFQDRVTVLERAAYSEETTVRFAAPERFLGNGAVVDARAQPVADATIEAATELTVQAETLDSRAQALGAIELVKIDVEGAEHHVLRGMANLFDTARVATVVFELVREHFLPEAWDDLGGLLRRMARGGASFSYIGPDGDTVAVTLDYLLDEGRFSQVVLDLT